MEVICFLANIRPCNIADYIMHVQPRLGGRGGGGSQINMTGMIVKIVEKRPYSQVQSKRGEICIFL